MENEVEMVQEVDAGSFSPSEAEVEAYMKAEGEYEFTKSKTEEGADDKESKAKDEGLLKKEEPKTSTTNGEEKIRALEEKLAFLSDFITKTAKRGEPDAKKVEKDEEELSYEDNPLQYLKKEIEALKGSVKGFSSEYTQDRQAAEMFSTIRNAAVEYQEKNPDYVNAYNYLRNLEFEEGLLMGFTREQSLQLVNKTEFEVLSGIVQSGKNPAEFVYKIAELRGYKPQKQESPPKEDAQKSVQEGKKKAKSLSNIGSQSASKPSDDSLDSILLIDDAKEFEEAFKKYEKKMRALEKSS